MHHSLQNRLTYNYLLALGFIALLSVVSYLIIEFALQSKVNDARLINLAGRQSTLAQKIIKTSLILEHDKRNTASQEHLNIFKTAFEEWTMLHDALQRGDEKLGLQGHKSRSVRFLFASLEPHYKSIKSASETILHIEMSNDQAMYGTFTIAVDSLLVHEKPFLDKMNQITQQLDHEAIERVNFMRNVQFYLMLFTLLVLILEALFIFRPVVRKTVVYFKEMQESQDDLEASNKSLKKAEETLKLQAEELRASEEEIRQNMEEMAAINENLMRSTEELKQKNEILKEATEVLDLKNKQIRRSHDMLYEQKQELDQKNLNITNSIRYAKKIQEAIIPEPSEVSKHFNDAFVLYHPKDIVSGDFYWFAEKKNKKILIAADCTGHGVPGALMTMMGNSLINQIVNEYKITNPSEILGELDKKVIDTLQKATDSDKKQIHDGMDMAVLVVDYENSTVEFAAAHNPLLYFQNGEIHQIKGSKFPVGSSQYKSNKKFELHTIQAQPGDVFYIFTDGFQDQYNKEHGRKYMSKRFRNFMLLISHFSMTEQKRWLDEEFTYWQGDSPQTDDILVIGIKF